MFNVIKNNLFLWIILFLLIVSPSLLLGVVQFVVVLIAGLVILILIWLLIMRIRIRRIMRQGGSSTGGEQRGSKHSTQGRTRVYQESSQEKKVSSDVGDYVDFEEIKD